MAGVQQSSLQTTWEATTTEHTEEKRPCEPESQKLEGKTAIVTGATTGIGRATGNLLVKMGVKVVIFGRHEKELQDALSDLKEIGGEV